MRNGAYVRRGYSSDTRSRDDLLRQRDRWNTPYSSIVTTGQCNGQNPQSYAAAGGSGVNQSCAWNDVRYLWTDGSFTTCTPGVDCTAPAWGWVVAPGDIVIIDAPDGNTYGRIGQSGPNSGDSFGLHGDPTGAGAPQMPSGTSGSHITIEGINHASCTADSAKAHIFGGYGVGHALTLSGSSYVDLACLDITDHSACGRGNQTDACSTSFPLSDFATDGIDFDRTSTHITLTDVNVHGLAKHGFFGPTGDGVTMNNIKILGNAFTGWDADPGDGSTGTGTLNVTNFVIGWSGCAEEYPIVDAVPYADCTDDNSGGQGDGFGTATVSASPGWQVHFDQGQVYYNTQDGLDALHLKGSGSSYVDYPHPGLWKYGATDQGWGSAGNGDQ